MKHPRYYLEYLYNVFLDMINLSETDVFNCNIGMNSMIDETDLKIMEDIKKERNNRWNNFRSKYT